MIFEKMEIENADGFIQFKLHLKSKKLAEVFEFIRKSREISREMEFENEKIDIVN